MNNRDPEQYGEAFARYYRTEILQKEGIESLRQLCNQPILEITSRNEGQSADKRVESAERLAHTIYQLSNERWETNPNIYLRAIDQVLEGLSIYEINSTLQATALTFERHYREKISARGESFSIVDQIVKRVGSQMQERVEAIFDCPDLSREAAALIDRSLNYEQRQEVAEKLTSYTPAQILALRNEAQHLCVQRSIEVLYEGRSITDSNQQKSSGAQKLRSLRDYLVKVQSKRSERNPVLTGFELEYLLLGRTDDELTRFAKVLASDNEKEEPKELLAEQVLAYTEGAIQEVLLKAIHDSADQAVHHLLDTEWRQKTFLKTRPAESFVRRLSSFAFNYEGENHRLLPDRRRLLNMPWSSEYIDLEFINTVQTIGEDHSPILNKSLWNEFRNSHDISLPYSYVQSRHSSIFQKSLLAAEFLKGRLASEFDMRRIFTQALFLDPWQYRQFDAYFMAESGEPFLDRLIETVNIERLTTAFLQRLVTGVLRYPFTFDLLREALRWQNEQAVQKQIEAAVAPLSTSLRNSLISGEAESEQKKRLLTQLMAGRSVDALAQLTLDYSKQSPQRRTLKQDISNTLGEEGEHLSLVLRAGLNPNSLYQSLQSNKQSLMRLHDIDPDIMVLFSEMLVKQGIQSLRDLQIHASDRKEVATHGIINETYRFTIETIALNKLLLRKERPQQFSSLLSVLDNCTNEELLHIERLYCMLFGSLREHLVYAHAQGFVDQSFVTSLVLRIEGIAADFFVMLEDSFASNNLALLCSLLSENRSMHSCIEEMYYYLYGEHLRTVIEDHWQDDRRVARASLLCLGYSADNLAQSMRELLLARTGQELGEKTLELLYNEGAPDQGARIPDDRDWAPQMLEQARQCYIEKFGTGYIESLKEKKVPDELINKICYRLYGTDAAELAVHIYKAIVESPDDYQRFRELIQAVDPSLLARTNEFVSEYFEADIVNKFDKIMTKVRSS